jgi:hypothetical protein
MLHSIICLKETIFRQQQNKEWDRGEKGEREERGVRRECK